MKNISRPETLDNTINLKEKVDRSFCPAHLFYSIDSGIKFGVKRWGSAG